MKNTNIFFLILTIFSHFGLHSCNNKINATTDFGNLIKVNAEENRVEILDFENLIDSISFIALETRPDLLISDISRVYLSENNLITYNSNTSEILIFNRNGEFKNRIGLRGNGPNDYIFFNDMKFDLEQGYIYAFERYMNKMYIYDLSGKLLKRIDSKFSFNSFCKSKDGYWIYSCFKKNNPNGYNLMHIDESMQNMTSGFFPQNSNFANATFANTFYTDNNLNHFFVYPTSDIVYQLAENEAIPYIQFDFKDKRMPYDLISQMDTNEEYDLCLNNNDYIGGFDNFIFFQNKVLFNFSLQKVNTAVTKQMAKFDIRTKDFFKYRAISNSMPIPININSLIGSTKNALIFLVNPAFLTKKEIDYLYRNGCNKIEADSNPVFMFYYLNENF